MKSLNKKSLIKIIITYIIALVCQGNIFGQTVCEGQYSVTDLPLQSASNESCTILRGTLVIDSQFEGDSLAGYLDDFTFIETLIISETPNLSSFASGTSLRDINIKNLELFGNAELKYVIVRTRDVGNISIHDNENLSQIGIESRTSLFTPTPKIAIRSNASLKKISIGGRFKDLPFTVIRNNPVLETIMAQNIETSGQLTILNNPLLKKIYFPRLESVTEGLLIGGITTDIFQVEYSPASRRYIYFPNLRFVSNIFALHKNQYLKDLSSFPNLLTVNMLAIRENPSLVSLDGIENLAIVRDSVVLKNNPALENFDALSGLRYVRKFTFIGNENLCYLPVSIIEKAEVLDSRENCQ